MDTTTFTIDLYIIWVVYNILHLFTGNQNVTFFELDSVMGHDTFLLDLTSIGHAVKGFLENDLNIS